MYYGRLFIPTNIEDLRAITSVADSGVVAEPTLPERDHFFETGVVHRFPAGIVGKLSAYHKRSAPGIDDNTVPGSAIVTSVNIDAVRVTGIEAAVEVHPTGPLSGYLNAALNHAWGHGPITGGFFPEDTPEGNFDLDHDQRLSIVASATWSRRAAWISGTAIYGSGLTNGADPDSTYGTGLFDFNKSIKVEPNTIINASAGYSFAFGQTSVRPQIYFDNIFDQKYLLKGAFFSGASVGRPRSVQLKIEVSI
jgi:outer membrane receptor protein involved in Fe transport